jgi:toxin-antitoxin system PIN domain toxin
LILVDANLLLYAYHAGASQHGAAKRWFEGALTGGDPVGLAWSTILAFLRIGTNSRVFERPYTIEDAAGIVTSWLEHPAVALLRPGERFWPILRELLIDARAEAAMVTDAALAALAVEHGAVLCSTDRDFRRFTRVKLLNPLESGG